MASIRIDIDERANDELDADIARLSDRRPLVAAIGKRAEVELHAHFRERESEPNERGWPKQHFWARILRGTALASVTESEATVLISDPAIFQKIHGGTIKPRETQFLAIPQVPEAVGRSPLVAIPRSSSSTSKKDRPPSKAKAIPLMKDGVIWYWLVREATQQPDPRALPDEEKFADAILDETQQHVDRVKKRERA
jgi:hypothetical protein